MVGSPSGWQEVPHLPAPATIADLANGATRISQIQGSAFGLFPGSLAKALRVFTTSCAAKRCSFLAPNIYGGFRACHHPLIGAFPARTTNGSRPGRRLNSSPRAWSGEFFDLARRHSLLAQSMEDDPTSAGDPQAKDRGLFSRPRQRPAAWRSVASCVQCAHPATDQSPHKAIGEDYLSGIFIGHDVLAQLGHVPPRLVSWRRPVWRRVTLGPCRRWGTVVSLLMHKTPLSLGQD